MRREPMVETSMIEVTRPLDVYSWFVIYTDDSSIGEYDQEEGLGFASVEHATVPSFESDRVKRVKTLLLLPRNIEGPPFGVDIPQGARPVFFRRRSIEINLTNDQTENRATTHCIGWTRGEQAVYLFIGDDGSVLLTENFQAI